MSDDSTTTPLKRCNRCKQFLPATSEYFVHDRSKKDGWCTLCRICKKTPKEQIPEGFKRCSTCEQVKLAADFFYRKGALDSLSSQCKECILKRQKEKYNAKHGIVPVPDGFRRCTTCNELKPATTEFFYSHPRMKHGVQAECRACRSADRKINPEKYRQAYLNRTEEQKDRQKQTGRRHQEKKKAQRHALKALALAGHEGEKQCPKCKQWYPATVKFFGLQRDRKSGLVSHCKRCQAKRTIERKPQRQIWRQINAEQISQYAREYRQTERGKELTRLNRKRTQAHRNAMQRMRYAQNPEHYRQLKKNFTKRHPEYVKQYCLTHREQRQANVNRRRLRLMSIPGTHTATEIQEQLRRQHHKCYYAACGFAKFKREKGKYVYHIEHTIPTSRLECDPRNEISHLVLACPSCNEKKGNKLPHEWPEGGRLL